MNSLEIVVIKLDVAMQLNLCRLALLQLSFLPLAKPFVLVIDIIDKYFGDAVLDPLRPLLKALLGLDTLVVKLCSVYFHYCGRLLLVADLIREHGHLEELPLRIFAAGDLALTRASERVESGVVSRLPEVADGVSPRDGLADWVAGASIRRCQESHFRG